MKSQTEERSSPTSSETIRSRRVLLPGADGVPELAAADIVVEGGRVAVVEPHGSVDGALDYRDSVIMPSLVDAHVHCNDPGRRDWEGFGPATCAAAAGGIGLIADMPLNSSPVTTSLSALHEKWAAACRGTKTDVALYAGLVPENAHQPEVLGALCGSGVVGWKAFLCDSGLVEFPAVGRDDLAAAMPCLAELGTKLLVHAELVPRASASEDGASRKLSSYEAFLRSRPVSFETEAVALVLELARDSGCPVHIVHVSAAETVELIRAAKEQGLAVTAETCPHYLYFAAEELAAADASFKCAPPIRSRRHRDALWSALTDGVIDFVASDHSPCPPGLKLRDADHGGGFDFASAWGGIASLQLLLPATFTAWQRHGSGNQSSENQGPQDRGTTELARWLSSAPARFLGFDRAPCVQAGMPANLVVWNPEQTFIVEAGDLCHRHPITPYAGEELSGKVEAHYLRGELIFEDTGCCESDRGRIVLAACQSDRDRSFLAATSDEARKELELSCGSRRFVELMAAQLPFADANQALAAADRAFDDLADEDWLEAFAAHPRIGDLASLKEKYRRSLDLSAREQSGAADASDTVLKQLAEGNRAYEERFGYLFIVFASGKSAREMLGLLEARLDNEPQHELTVASREQRKITRLRLLRS